MSRVNGSDGLSQEGARDPPPSPLRGLDAFALAERYSGALRSYLAGGGKVALQQAYEVGQDALEAGVRPLALFSMHRDVVQKLPPRPIEADDFVSQVTTVFIEALASFQMTAGSFDEARAGVADLGSTLQRHTQELRIARRGFGREQRPQLDALEAVVARHASEIEDVRHRLESAQQTAYRRRQLVADIVHAQEEERQRLAGDIHDDAVQAMTAVLLRIGLLGARLKDGEHAHLIGELEEAVRGTIARLRRLIMGLAPLELDRAGLASTVRSALDQHKHEFGLNYRFSNRLSREPSAEARTIAYRIVQEALANARKHAQASSLEVILESRDEGLLALVKDDGVGFDVEPELARVRPGHLGLAAMRERAELATGWLRLESGPDGTTVRFWIPDTPDSVIRSQESWGTV